MTGRSVTACRTGFAALICAGLAACMPQPDGRDAGSGARAFQANCAGCHGAEGQGGALPATPRLTGLAAANDGVFPAARVLGVLEGHARNPEFSDAMPEFGGSGMGAGPVVDVPGIERPVPARTAGLLAYLRSIQD